MNGPTRTSAFDRPGSVGAGRHKSADIYDELDQFVDAEPPVWGPAHQTPASARSAGSPAEQGDGDSDPAADPYSDRDPSLERDPYAERDPATGQRRDDRRFDQALAGARDGASFGFARPAARGRDDEAGNGRHDDPYARPQSDPEPGFSREGGDRRARFSQRLNEELERPRPRQERSDPTLSGADEQRQARSPEPRSPEQRPSDELRAREAARIRRELDAGSALDAPGAAPPRGLMRSPAGAAQPGTPVRAASTSHNAAAPHAAGQTTPVQNALGESASAQDPRDWRRSRNGAEASAPPPAAEPDEPPADALDWELGHAISEIINGRAYGNQAAQPSTARLAAEAASEAVSRSLALPGNEGGPAIASPVPDAPPHRPSILDRPEPPIDAEDFHVFDDEDEAVPSPTIAGSEPDASDAVDAPAPAAGPPRSRATPVAADIPLAAARAATQRDGGSYRETAPVPPAARGPVNPKIDLSAKRTKPIPSFRFDRREDEADPFPAAPPDLDDPLAPVFLTDARGALKDQRSNAYTQYGEEDAFEEFGGEALEFEDADDRFDDDLPPSLARASQRVRGHRRGGAKRGIAVAVGSLAAVIVAGIGGFSLIGGDSAPSGEPPVIVADARDVKTRPAEEESTARPDISERIALGDEDRLVVPDPVRIGPQEAPPSPVPETETRSVRTVTVLPDGSILRPGEGGGRTRSTTTGGQDGTLPQGAAQGASSGSARSARSDPSFDVAANTAVRTIESDARDETLDGPGTNSFGSSSPGLAADDAAADFPTADEEGDAFAPAGDGTDVDGFDTGSQGADAAGAAANVPTPRPAPARPAPGRTVQTARATPAATSPVQTQAQPAAASFPWAVQLASRRERASAEASFRTLQQRFPSILGSATPMIAAANVGDQGVFYRVRVGTNSFGEANSLCERLKNAGADCFVGRN